MKGCLKTIRGLLVLMLVVGLTGCATGGAAPDATFQKVEAEVKASPAKVEGGLAHIAQFTSDDLQAALADAQAKKDVAASNCYQTLLGIIQVGMPKAPPIKGVVSAFQLSRDLIRSGSGASSLGEQINIGCAALFIDVEYTLAKLGIMAGGMAAGAPGAGAAIGAIPGLVDSVVPALPKP